MNGFSKFYSPILCRPDNSNSVLPGSCMFVSCSLNPEQTAVCHKVAKECSVLNVSCCFISYKLQQTAVISVYRSPSNCVYSAIHDLCSIFLELSYHVKFFTIVGDFNINLLCDSNIKEEYVNLLSDFYLVQHMIEPSHETSTSASLIDHVITSKDTPVLRLLQMCGLSDHKVQIANLGYFSLQSSSRGHQILSLRKRNWDELRHTLQSVPWQIMSVYDDIDDKWSYFYALLQECLDKFLPLKKVTSQKSKRPTPWFNNEILQQIKLKNKAKRIFERSRLEGDGIIYKKYKNELKTSIRNAKINCLKSLMTKAKLCPQLAADLWSQVNSIIGRRQCINKTTPMLSLDLVNDQFQNVAITSQHKPASHFVLPFDDVINNDQ